MIIVGDSLAMISYGHANTLPLTVDTMIQHCQAVRRGAPNTFVFAAMPYGSVATPDLAIRNALRFMQEGGVECVKIQAGRRQFHIIEAIAKAGIPVMGHVGMCPHYMHQYGGFKVQGKTAASAAAIVDDAARHPGGGRHRHGDRGRAVACRAGDQRGRRHFHLRHRSRTSESWPSVAGIRPHRRIRSSFAEVRQTVCRRLEDRGRGPGPILRRGSCGIFSRLRSIATQCPRTRAAS